MAQTASGIEFDVIWNDEREEALVKLIELKDIFSVQLPKMPKEYIVRLVFDKNHRSLIISKTGPKPKVIGGVCFRPFYEQNFSEIVFCAISSAEQVKGYGMKMMNQLKEYTKIEGIFNFLTFADNYAIGYFKKQGFTRVSSLANSQWAGFIKEYDGGTLMECHLHPRVDYLHFREILSLQKQYALGELRKISNSHVVHRGIKQLEDGPVDYGQIAGLKEAGWSCSQKRRKQSRELEDSHLLAKIGAIVKAVKNTKESWPFLAAVDAKQVPDYYSIIKNPMDLAIITTKLNDRRYRSKDEFATDFRLIIDNCKTYNAKESNYYRCADTIEKLFGRLIESVK
ncbi:DeSI-like protein hag1 [Bonamia ostreae]|uniref:histone acetyltransferase n=1 Tax=Bonamia ostreae TaxID=126728 RepID=A0ABV2AE44_9EUKA